MLNTTTTINSSLNASGLTTLNNNTSIKSNVGGFSALNNTTNINGSSQYIRSVQHTKTGISTWYAIEKLLHKED